MLEYEAVAFWGSAIPPCGRHLASQSHSDCLKSSHVLQVCALSLRFFMHLWSFLHAYKCSTNLLHLTRTDVISRTRNIVPRRNGMPRHTVVHMDNLRLRKYPFSTPNSSLVPRSWSSQRVGSTPLHEPRNVVLYWHFGWTSSNFRASTFTVPHCRMSTKGLDVSLNFIWGRCFRSTGAVGSIYRAVGSRAWKSSCRDRWRLFSALSNIMQGFRRPVYLENSPKRWRIKLGPHASGWHIVCCCANFLSTFSLSRTSLWLIHNNTRLRWFLNRNPFRRLTTPWKLALSRVAFMAGRGRL